MLKQMLRDFGILPEKYDKPLSVRKKKRVKRRDNYTCLKCGKSKNLQIHHKTSRSQGGTNRMSNLQTLCASCHAREHRSVPDNFIKSKPYSRTPRWWSEFKTQFKAATAPLWKPFFIAGLGFKIGLNIVARFLLIFLFGIGFVIIAWDIIRIMKGKYPKDLL